MGRTPTASPRHSLIRPYTGCTCPTGKSARLQAVTVSVIECFLVPRDRGTVLPRLARRCVDFAAARAIPNLCRWCGRLRRPPQSARGAGHGSGISELSVPPHALPPRRDLARFPQRVNIPNSQHATSCEALRGSDRAREWCGFLIVERWLGRDHVQLMSRGGKFCVGCRIRLLGALRISALASDLARSHFAELWQIQLLHLRDPHRRLRSCVVAHREGARRWHGGGPGCRVDLHRRHVPPSLSFSWNGFEKAFHHALAHK